MMPTNGNRSIQFLLQINAQAPTQQIELLKRAGDGEKPHPNADAVAGIQQTATCLSPCELGTAGKQGDTPSCLSVL